MENSGVKRYFLVTVVGREFSKSYLTYIIVKEGMLIASRLNKEDYQKMFTNMLSKTGEGEIQSVGIQDAIGGAHLVNWDYVWYIDITEVDENGEPLKQPKAAEPTPEPTDISSYNYE